MMAKPHEATEASLMDERTRAGFMSR
jgi:hypothetical protein